MLKRIALLLLIFLLLVFVVPRVTQSTEGVYNKISIGEDEVQRSLLSNEMLIEAQSAALAAEGHAPHEIEAELKKLGVEKLDYDGAVARIFRHKVQCAQAERLKLQADISQARSYMDENDRFLAQALESGSDFEKENARKALANAEEWRERAGLCEEEYREIQLMFFWESASISRLKEKFIEQNDLSGAPTEERDLLYEAYVDNLLTSYSYEIVE